jgi:hypothetical protein
VSQQTVSRLERGRVTELSIGALGGLLTEIEAELELNVRWRGGELDRVMDEGHAQLVGAIVKVLERAGWTAIVEVTYSIGRERGSIDVLGYLPGARALLVIEVKADLTTAEGTLRRQDEKVRLAPEIVRARFGWAVATVSKLLVLPDASTPRRRLARHAALFDRTHPLRGVAFRRWLMWPTSSIGAVIFLSITHGTSDRRDLGSRRRISRRPREVDEHGAAESVGFRGARFIDSTVEHSSGE